MGCVRILESILGFRKGVEEGGAQFVTQLEIVPACSWKDRAGKVNVKVIPNLFVERCQKNWGGSGERKN